MAITQQSPSKQEIRFLAYTSSTYTNVTGDGTEYIIVFDTEVVDVGSAYNNSTGAFVAPVTGLYLFNYGINLNGISSTDHTSIASDMRISSPNLIARTIIGTNNATSASQYLYTASGFGYLTVGDSVRVQVGVAGSAKTVDIVSDGAGYLDTWFGGYLIG